MILRGNKISILSFIVLLLGVTLGVCYGQVPGEFKGRVTSDNINVRSDSTVNSEIICAVKKGEAVQVVSELYEWYKIRLPKLSPSFIKKEMVTLIDNKSGVVRKDSVNIRLHPQDSSWILGSVNTNEIVQILKERPGWYQIEPVPNSFGWIHKKFVQKLTMEESEPAKPVKEEVIVTAEIKPPDINVTVEGTLRPKTMKAIATHKLICQENKVFLIKGAKDKLNPFNFHKVRVTGRLTNATDLEYPIIEVIKIEDLK